MTHQPSDQEFLTSVKQVLDQSQKDLDAPTRGRLQAMRRRALDLEPQRARPFVWAGGLATAAMALILAGFWLQQPGPSDPLPSLEDVEILAAVEDLEFYEDLDFYTWLADADIPG